MPRGRKKALTPEEQLEKLVSEIEETENKLKELKAKKKELEEAVKMNRVVELEEFISSRGLSIDEVKELGTFIELEYGKSVEEEGVEEVSKYMENLLYNTLYAVVEPRDRRGYPYQMLAMKGII